MSWLKISCYCSSTCLWTVCGLLRMNKKILNEIKKKWDEDRKVNLVKRKDRKRKRKKKKKKKNTVQERSTQKCDKGLTFYIEVNLML